MRRIDLLCTCWLISTVAGAQQDGLELEQMVVTASRTPISLNDTGSSITIVTREEIERRQALSIADLLRDVPGIAVSQSGGLGSRTQVRVRGAEANHVLVMIDGVEANDPAAGDEFQFEHLSTSDIERIEIVRGPQSALWGSDAVSGIINVVTQDASGTSGANGFLETGSFGTARLGGNLGAENDTRRLRFGVSYVDTDGTNVSRSGDEDDGYRNGTANLAGRWNLASPVQLELVARHTAATTQFDAIDFDQTGLPADADRASDSAQTYVSLAASYLPAGAFTQRLKLTYLDSASDELEAGSTVSSLGAEKIGVYYQGTVEFATRRIGALTFALDHEQTDFKQRGIASPFGDPNQDQHIDTTGYIVEYRFEPIDRFHLSTSLRHDENSDFDSVTTYRMTGAYSLAGRGTRLRASLGTGQKSPTFTDRFGFFPDEFLGNPALRPEKSRGWEIGIDRALLDDRLSFGATYFDERLTNEINGFVFDSTMGQFTAANIDGFSDRRGLEFSASGALTQTLSLTAAYTYLDSTEPDANDVNVTEIRRPKHIAALNVNYAPSTRLDLNLNLAYNGAQYDTFFPPFPDPAERVELSSYALVTLAGSLALSERLELVGRIENLLDEEYEDVYGFATPGAGAYIGIRTRR